MDRGLDPKPTLGRLGAIVGGSAGGADRLTAVDRLGSPILGREDVTSAGLGDASDLVRLSDHDAPQVTRMGSSLAMARVRACL